MFRKISFCFFLCCQLFAADLPEYPVVILGSGVAGLSAAIQVAQAGVQPVVITGLQPGGLITKSDNVQNWPGEFEISGIDLADKLQKQAEERGTIFYPSMIQDIDVSKQPFIITLKTPFEKNKIQQIRATTVIITMGAQPKRLNVPGESENMFLNIFTCAPCDGLRFKDKTVAIIGGGDSALSEAHYLSAIAKKVILIVRKGQFKTIQPREKDAILARPNVEVFYNTSVQSFDKKPQGLNLQLTTPTGEKPLLVDGAFLAIGSLPNTALFKGKLKLDKAGYIVLKNDQETTTAGIYAAGDICDPAYKQAVTAAGDAVKAALQAQQHFPATTVIQPAPPTGEVKTISSLADLQQAIKQAQKPVVASFSERWCPPCRALKFTFNRWAKEYEDQAVFVRLDGEACPECFDQYDVHSFPTILVFNSQGKVIYRATGFEQISNVPDEIQKESQLSSRDSLDKNQNLYPMVFLNPKTSCTTLEPAKKRLKGSMRKSQ